MPVHHRAQWSPAYTVHRCTYLHVGWKWEKKRRTQRKSTWVTWRTCTTPYSQGWTRRPWSCEVERLESTPKLFLEFLMFTDSPNHMTPSFRLTANICFLGTTLDLDRMKACTFHATEPYAFSKAPDIMSSLLDMFLSISDGIGIEHLGISN